MASFNQANLLGNITKDIELRYTPKGTAIASFSLALNHVYKVGDEKREEVTFVEIDAFGKTAEIISEYCRKGDPILISGRLKQDNWEDKQTGQKRSKLKVVVDTMQLLGKKRSDEVREEREKVKPQAPAPTAKELAQRQADAEAFGEEDEDIPF